MMLSPKSLTKANLINNTIRLVEPSKDDVPEAELKSESSTSAKKVGVKNYKPFIKRNQKKVIIPAAASAKNSIFIDESNNSTKREGPSETQHRI
jgi:hypothetical protein